MPEAEDVLDRQAAELGLPCQKLHIPSPCPNEVYEASMGQALVDAKARGITHFVFGDLFLADIRAYREQKLDAYRAVRDQLMRQIRERFGGASAGNE